MQTQERIGGGLKKVMHTLRMARDAGWQPTAKALTAKNTCKACGLGMGGQDGGMTNELGEFPAVCNKSVQAQSSDLQPPIPPAVLAHPLSDLQELSEHEMNSLGRLNQPLFKAADNDRYIPVSWDVALDQIAQRMRRTAAARSFFYSSGRSSNEAGFLLQLLARLYGTNNVNNCSYYCHQATSVGLSTTIGTGTATVELADLAGSDMIFLVGANPASNHPRFIYQLQGVRQRGGEVVVINPAREPGLIRFATPKSARSLLAGGTEIASCYLQPNIGSDIAVLNGIAKAVLELRGEDSAFIGAHTADFASYRTHIEALSWPAIERQAGLSKATLTDCAARYCDAENVVFAWGMGLTHHTHGVANIEALANLAMLRGMLGRPNAGLLPLRGHSNVQGIGTIGVKPVLSADVMRALEDQLHIALPTTPGMDTMAAMQAASRDEIDLAVIMGGNLFAANPDSHWASRALDQICTKVYLTTTLNRGHVHGLERSESFILPVTARDEEWQATTQESMFNYVRLSDGGITRQDNARPESHILCTLGSAVIDPQTFDFSPFQEHKNIRRAIASIVPGLAELADIDVAKRQFHITNRLMHTPTFNTASGKCHFQTIESQRETSGRAFMLASVRSEGQFNSIVYEEEDTYRGVPHRWCIMMSPADLRALSLHAQDRVDVISDVSLMRAVQVVPFDLPQGNVLAYFPEANVLIDTAVDPRSKTPGFKSVPVTIRKTVSRKGPRSTNS